MPREDRLESYPRYIADWRNSERVMAMCPAARGIYIELLDRCWESGDLPSSDLLLSDFARSSRKDWLKHKTQVMSMFDLVGGRYRHHKVDEKRPNIMSLKEKRQVIGQAGGRASAKAKSYQLPDQELEPDSSKPQPKFNPTPVLDPPPALDLDPKRAEIELHGIKRNGKQHTFLVDCLRFEREFWKPISDQDMKNFISQVRNKEDEDLFFSVLSARKSEPKFDPQYQQSAEKYLTTGMWKKMPKQEKPFWED